MSEMKYGAKPIESTAFVFCLVFLTVIFPPIGVIMIHDSIGQILINLLLTVVFAWIPGHIHAFYLIYQYFKGNRPQCARIPVASGHYGPAPVAAKY